MKRTRVCEILGIKYPLLEAPMGEKMGARLSAAVSNAGGIGCIRQEPIPLYGNDPRVTLHQELAVCKSLTDKPIMINVKFSQEDAALRSKGLGTREAFLDAVFEEMVKDAQLKKMIVAIYTSAGDALPYGKRIKDAGLKWIHKVSRLGQARRAEQAGVDILVAMSNAAGAHLGSAQIDNMVLIPLLAESVKTPIVGSGGFVDGKSLAAAILLGAEGVEMGTRLIATQEGDFHPNAKQAIVDHGAEDTMVVPGRLASLRMFKNDFAIRHMKRGGGKTEEEIKLIDPKLKEELSVEFHEGLRIQIEKGDMVNCALPVGQGMGRIHDIPTVDALFKRMMKEADEAIRAAAARV